MAGGQCVLDVAARGSQTQQTIGDLLQISKQRVEQIEKQAMIKVTLAINPDLSDALEHFANVEGA